MFEQYTPAEIKQMEESHEAKLDRVDESFQAMSDFPDYYIKGFVDSGSTLQEAQERYSEDLSNLSRKRAKLEEIVNQLNSL